MSDRSPKSRSPSRSPKSGSHSRSRSPKSRSHGPITDSKLWSALGAADCKEYRRRNNSKSPIPSSRLNLTGYSIDFTGNKIEHISEQGDRTTKKLDEESKAALEKICSDNPNIKPFFGGPHLVNPACADMEPFDKIFMEIHPKGLPKPRPKGGSRRRPSRKYKKSKRVMRRKSRSTRRR